MLLTMLKGKIHDVAVTGADLHYQGSIQVDLDWLDHAGILPHEQVHVYNVTNGARLVTYALAGSRGSKQVMLNGAAARLAAVGDRVIIVAYAQMDEYEARAWRPRVFLPNDPSHPAPVLTRGR